MQDDNLDLDFIDLNMGCPIDLVRFHHTEHAFVLCITMLPHVSFNEAQFWPLCGEFCCPHHTTCINLQEASDEL